MKRFILSVLIFTFVIMASTTTKAFDGNRKGFVLSGGIGITKQKNSVRSNIISQNKFTIGWMLGYGFNNKNFIVLDRTASFANRDGTLFMDQTAGLGLYHYFSTEKKTTFLNIGYEYSGETGYGGGGYMFGNNIQLGLTYTFIDNSNADYKIKLLVSYVAF